MSSDGRCFVTHLECSATGERHDADTLHNVSRAGKPLLVRYDLESIGKQFDKATLAGRPAEHGSCSWSASARCCAWDGARAGGQGAILGCGRPESRRGSRAEPA